MIAIVTSPRNGPPTLVGSNSSLPASLLWPSNERAQRNLCMTIGLLFIGAVVLFGVFILTFVIGGYNALVTLRNRYKNAYSQIDVQLNGATTSYRIWSRLPKAIFNMSEGR